MMSQLVQNIFDITTPASSGKAGPLAAGEILPAMDEGDHLMVANDENTSQPPWVLHVEDDEEFSLAIKTRLEAHGVAVIRADNGTQGYHSAFFEPPGAIILDMEMPNGQGDYVLRRLKENPLTQRIPVVVLTGRKESSLERRMYNLGAAKFLTKPVEMDQLLKTLSDHIDVLPEPALMS